MASTVPAKSQSLHNFALPRLKWNNNHPRGGRSSSSNIDAAKGTQEQPPSATSSQSPLRSSHSPLRQSPLRQSAMRNSPLHSGGGGGDGGTEPEGSGKGKSAAGYKRHAKNRSENHDRIVEKSEEKPKLFDSDHVANLNISDNKSNDKEPRSKILIKIPASMRNSGNSKVKEEENQVTVDEQKAWNLRPRRPVKKSLNADDGGSGGVGLKAVGGGSLQEKKDQLQQDNLENGTRVRAEKENKVKFSLSLTRREIEEDIYSLTGSKAARRPKKRAKVVQKYLDNVFPGQWLASVTPDSYKVSDHCMKG